MRVALVHDWLNQNGGAELVLEELLRVFPGAPVFTSFYDPEVMPPAYREWDIRTTFMQRIPGLSARHQAALPLYPAAFNGLDLRGFDLVISNSSGFAHLAKAPPGALHLNYCLTPPRFLWNLSAYAQRENIAGPARVALEPVITLLQQVDLQARRRVNRFAGISRAVVERIRRIYGRPADLVYPPVLTERFRPNGQPPEDFALVVSRLIPYKRVDLAVRAYSRLGRPLVVVGSGRDLEKLRALAGPTVRFTGRLPQPEVVDLVQRCRVFLFPGEEDFGIAPVEAQAAGRPVIAFAGGGALDTVEDGVTGVLFHEQTVEALMAAVDRFEGLAFDPAVLRARAERFAAPVFRDAIRRWVTAATGEVLPLEQPGVAGLNVVEAGTRA